MCRIRSCLNLGHVIGARTVQLICADDAAVLAVAVRVCGEHLGSAFYNTRTNKHRRRGGWAVVSLHIALSGECTRHVFAAHLPLDMALGTRQPPVGLQDLVRVCQRMILQTCGGSRHPAAGAAEE